LFPGGLGAKSFVPYAKGYGVTVTEREAQKLRSVWMDAFPEMEHHLNPDPMLMDDGSEMYKSTLLTGRVRAGCTLMACMNTEFQGLTSDGAKLALWEVFKRNYKTVVFIHDELIIELPDDEYLTPRVAHIQELMASAMKQVIPDVRVGTGVCAMYQWAKDAEEVRDEQGRLLPWFPPETHED